MAGASEVTAPNVAVFGSITCDVLVQCDALPKPGETVLGGPSYELAAGGKGANQAYAAAAAGATVEMVCRVGGRGGDEALEEDAFAQVASAGLRRRKVAMRTHTDFERRTALATVATCRSSGENQIIVAAGANAALTAAQFEEQSAALASGRADPTRPWAVILQGEVPPEANWEVAAKAHAAGAFVLLNNAPARRVPHEACRHLDMIAVNEGEAMTTCKHFGLLVDELRSSDSQQSSDVVQALQCGGDGEASRAVEAARCLFVATGVPVCLTLGSHGAVVFNEEEAVTVRQTLEVKVVSTVGAGDASLGALIAALVEQRPLEEALRRATAAGTLACSGEGAQDAAPDDEAITKAARQLVSRTVAAARSGYAAR